MAAKDREARLDIGGTSAGGRGPDAGDAKEGSGGGAAYRDEHVVEFGLTEDVESTVTRFDEQGMELRAGSEGKGAWEHVLKSVRYSPVVTVDFAGNAEQRAMVEAANEAREAAGDEPIVPNWMRAEDAILEALEAEGAWAREDGLDKAAELVGGKSDFLKADLESEFGAEFLEDDRLGMPVVLDEYDQKVLLIGDREITSVDPERSGLAGAMERARQAGGITEGIQEQPLTDTQAGMQAKEAARGVLSGYMDAPLRGLATAVSEGTDAAMEQGEEVAPEAMKGLEEDKETVYRYTPEM